MQFIRLTSAAPTSIGKPILINAKINIISIFEATATREDGTVDDVTYIYSPEHGSWEVSEGVDVIHTLLKEIFQQQ